MLYLAYLCCPICGYKPIIRCNGVMVLAYLILLDCIGFSWLSYELVSYDVCGRRYIPAVFNGILLVALGVLLLGSSLLLASCYLTRGI